MKCKRCCKQTASQHLHQGNTFYLSMLKMQTESLTPKINCKHRETLGLGKAFCLVKLTLSSRKNKQRNYSHLFVCLLIGSFITFGKLIHIRFITWGFWNIALVIKMSKLAGKLSCCLRSLLHEQKLWKRPLELSKFNNLFLCYAWMKTLFFYRYLRSIYQPMVYNIAVLESNTQRMVL